VHEDNSRGDGENAWTGQAVEGNELLNKHRKGGYTAAYLIGSIAWSRASQPAPRTTLDIRGRWGGGGGGACLCAAATASASGRRVRPHDGRAAAAPRAQQGRALCEVRAARRVFACGWCLVAASVRGASVLVKAAAAAADQQHQLSSAYGSTEVAAMPPSAEPRCHAMPAAGAQWP
jgi:hypothetical protein